MYCPRCAAQNLDDAKFCRACGTNLESVALALSGKYSPAKPDDDEDEALQTAKTPLEKRREGVNSIVKGTGLFVASLMIGVALGLFSNAPDWGIIWVAMAGWMACWGIISMATGIGAIMESKFMARQLEQTFNEAAAQKIQTSPIGEARILPDASAASGLPFPPSVTEQTTEPLVKQYPTSKRAS
jgi:hypothetical protein